MDIKEQISKIVEEITKNGSIKELFENEPVKAVEQVLGIDLPDEIIEQIINGVKAKISIDSIAQVSGMLKNIFKKDEEQE